MISDSCCYTYIIEFWYVKSENLMENVTGDLKLILVRIFVIMVLNLYFENYVWKILHPIIVFSENIW